MYCLSYINNIIDMLFSAESITILSNNKFIIPRNKLVNSCTVTHQLLIS